MESLIYDISVPVTSTLPVWPGDPRVTIRQLSSIEQGAESNLSQIRMCVHTGTHIDAPRHFIDDGKTIEQIALQKLIGKALVMAFRDDISIITEEVLTKHPLFTALQQTKKVLFKTRNSAFWHDRDNKFHEDYVGLDHTATQCLADLGMDLIGVDYLSIAAYQDTEEPHKILLGREVVLLEGIDLTDVQEGFYELYCLPMLLSGCEGAPARAILKNIYLEQSVGPKRL